MYGKFCVIFFQLYPTHSRSVYDPTRMILAILYNRCPICFMQNISLIGTVVLEKKSFEQFLPYMGMAAILNFERKIYMLNMKFQRLAKYFHRKCHLNFL